MIIICNILLVKDKVHAIPADIGKTIKPKSVIDRVIEVEVAPMITIASTDFNIVFGVFKNFILVFWFMIVIFEVSNHFFDVVDMVIESIYVIFFSNRCSESIFFFQRCRWVYYMFLFHLYSIMFTNLPK